MNIFVNFLYVVRILFKDNDLVLFDLLFLGSRLGRREVVGFF